MTYQHRDEAIREYTANVIRAREEYRKFPHAGHYDAARRQPCLQCETPTYSRAGLCATCLKETR